MSQSQQLIPLAKAIGLTSGAFLTAYIASFSLVTVPSLLAAPGISAEQLAKQWKKAFELGGAFAPPFAVTTASCFAFLAWTTRTIKPLPSALPVPVSALYLGAAVLAPCIVPYTRTIMWPGITALSAKADGKPDAPSDAETKALLEKWSGQNFTRAGFVGLATLLGLLGMVV